MPPGWDSGRDGKWSDFDRPGLCDWLGGGPALCASRTGSGIIFTGWLFVDPLVSIFIAALIGWNAFRIVGETVNILLEGAPRGVDLSAVRMEIATVEGVTALHDLHVWAISSENMALSAHVVVVDQSLADSEHVVRELESRLCAKFAIGHTTVQVEFCHPCAAESDHPAEHNHPHAKLIRLATAARRQTPLSHRTRSKASR